MKIYLDTVGCRLNQSEIETFARQFRAAGHVVVADPADADRVVINTCSVTAQAASDSRQKIRQAARAGNRDITAAGCWATLHPQEAAALPGVSRVTPNAEKDRLVPDMLGLPPEAFDLEPVERVPLPGARQRTRAFIKAQDGCDNRCAFCVTTIARGPGRSRSIADVLADVRAAQAGGAQEIVLTGVHLGSWGYDFSPPQRLRQLIAALLAESDIPRLRLSSLEPWDLDEEFFGLWQNARLCRHLHLPLQSGCAATLRRMARKTMPEAFAALITAARAAIPEVSITTDVIVGFPGEDEAEFAESAAFIYSQRFAGGHVFTYSARAGTAAARMRGQVRHALRKERNALLRHTFAESAAEYGGIFIGRQLPVLWESAASLSAQGWEMAGLTDNNLRVTAIAPEPLWNIISQVRLTTRHGDDLQGEIVV